MENNLTTQQRNRLRMIVFIVLLIFLIGYSFFLFKNRKQSPNQVIQSALGKVVFQQPTIKIFGYTELLNTYPDHILIHNPYLLVVHPTDGITNIYNLRTQKKERQVKGILLDYYRGDLATNIHGSTTYFNNKNLNILCDQAFIQSEKEILCITRPDATTLTNKLISINLQTGEQKAIYSSQNALTAMFTDKDTLYLGEYNFESNKAFLSVNGKLIPSADLINIIYPIQNTIYFASFKSVRNNQIESYYSLQGGKVRLIKKGEINF